MNAPMSPEQVRAALVGIEQQARQYLRAKREVEKLAALLWKQEKLRVKSNETDAINRIVDDVEMVMHEHAKDGVLPKDNVLP